MATDSKNSLSDSGDRSGAKRGSCVNALHNEQGEPIYFTAEGVERILESPRPSLDVFDLAINTLRYSVCCPQYYSVDDTAQVIFHYVCHFLHRLQTCFASFLNPCRPRMIS